MTDTAASISIRRFGPPRPSLPRIGGLKMRETKALRGSATGGEKGIRFLAKVPGIEGFQPISVTQFVAQRGPYHRGRRSRFRGSGASRLGTAILDHYNKKTGGYDPIIRPLTLLQSRYRLGEARESTKLATER